MNKLARVLGGMALALLLVGQGCNTNFGGGESPTPSSTAPVLDLGVTPSPTTRPEATDKPEEAMKKDDTAMSADLKNATLTLTGEALDNRQVKFTWETDAKLSDANRFIIVRSDKENPSHTGTNQWSRFAYTVREAMLANQSLGSFHYRVCLTENNNPDVCVKYSDDVTVEVK